jgi:hypothetical protein
LSWAFSDFRRVPMIILGTWGNVGGNSSPGLRSQLAFRGTILAAFSAASLASRGDTLV